MKTCLKCKKTELISEFHKDAQKSDGLRPYCKVCSRAMVKASEEEIRNKGAYSRTSTKKCGSCGIVKAASEFSRHTGKLDGLNGACKVCNGKRTNRYYQEKRRRN